MSAAAIPPAPRVTVMGVGNILLGDEGFGVRVVEALERGFTFADDVLVVDGGVLGVGLLGIISQPRHLIVVDAVRNGGDPGTPYRLAGADIPLRIRAKNSLHQVDLLEALTLCQALDHVPKTVIIGVEPADIQTLQVALTPVMTDQVGPTINRVLAELDRLGAGYTPREAGKCA